MMLQAVLVSSYLTHLTGKVTHSQPGGIVTSDSGSTAFKRAIHKDLTA